MTSTGARGALGTTTSNSGTAASTGGAGGSLDAYYTEVMADSPLAYFRLDDTDSTQATDSSGNGYHGSFIGGVVLGSPGVLANNAAATFGANFDTRVEVSMGPFAFDGATPFSVEAWTNAQLADGAIVGKIDYFTGAHFGWWMASRIGGEFRFYRTIPGGSFLNGGVVVINQWHHVVAVFDSNQSTALLYVDGVLVDSTTQSGTLHVLNRPLMIGNGGSWKTFEGRIDEVAIYSHALTQARIAAHYAAANPP